MVIHLSRLFVSGFSTIRIGARDCLLCTSWIIGLFFMTARISAHDCSSLAPWLLAP